MNLQGKGRFLRLSRHNFLALKLDKWREYYKSYYPERWKKRVLYYGFTEYHKIILKLIGTKKGEQVLECGIGTGYPLAICLAKAGANITGIDIAQSLLDQCRLNFQKEGLPINCLRGDIEQLPFEDGSFDRVYCISTTWYLPNIRKALSEMVRVTKRGGIIVFDIMNLFHISSLSIYAYNLIRNTTLVQKIRPSHGLNKYRSPSRIHRILKDLNVSYTVKGYYIFLPVCLPLLGYYADICKYSKTLSYGLADPSLKYFSSKLVYILKKES